MSEKWLEDQRLNYERYEIRAYFTNLFRKLPNRINTKSKNRKVRLNSNEEHSILGQSLCFVLCPDVRAKHWKRKHWRKLQTLLNNLLVMMSTPGLLFN